MLLEQKHCDPIAAGLVTRWPLSDQWMCTEYSVDTLDKGVIHISGGTGQEGVRFHHATQNGVKTM